MSNLTSSLHPVSDAHPSTQLVLQGHGAQSNTSRLPYSGYYPSSSGAISGLDAGNISGMAVFPCVTTSDAMYPHVVHNEFVQSNWGGSYTSTFSSLSNALGDEWQAPALPPPSPNPSTTATSGRSGHEVSPSTFASTSSSLDDALGRDWLSRPLPLPCTSPPTPKWRQPVPMSLSPTHPPTITNPGLPFNTAPLSFPASGGSHSLPKVESFSPRIEEKQKNNLKSHLNGGNPEDHGLAAEPQIIRQQGRGTNPSKKPKTQVNRKPSKIPVELLGRFRVRPEPKGPRDNNQGRRWDLEDWGRK